MEDKTSNNTELNRLLADYKTMLKDKLSRTEVLIKELESYKDELSAIIKKL
tara:strand:- start:6219 stop:6371 length:153 start_codon:yes stop_codon:yes gene_type:complete